MLYKSARKFSHSSKRKIAEITVSKINRKQIKYKSKLTHHFNTSKEDWHQMKRGILYKALNQIYEPFASVEEENLGLILIPIYICG